MFLQIRLLYLCGRICTMRGGVLLMILLSGVAFVRNLFNLCWLSCPYNLLLIMILGRCSGSHCYFSGFCLSFKYFSQASSFSFLFLLLSVGFLLLVFLSLIFNSLPLSLSCSLLF